MKDGARLYLASVKVAQTRRGDRRLYLKEDYAQKHWNVYNKMKASFDEDALPEQLQGGHGHREKVGTILRELGPFMKAHKRQFWERLSQATAENGLESQTRALPRKTTSVAKSLDMKTSWVGRAGTPRFMRD